MTDDRVRFTDDQAAWSKTSSVKRGYWDDQALVKCIPKGPRRSPLVHAVYYMRHRLVDTVLREVIERSTFTQMLILGAGTDTSFWRLEMATKAPHIKWFEIDFPHNLEAKQKLLDQNYGKADNYHPVPSDLRNMNQVGENLAKNGFDFNVQTFVLSEVVLAYLTDQYSTKCIEWLGAKLPKCFFVEYEQFQPSSSFGQIMTRHFDKMGSPLKTIKQLPTLEHRRSRLSNAGFVDHRVMPMIDIGLTLPQLEPFDEWEALHTVMKHYYVGFSLNFNSTDASAHTDAIFRNLKIDKLTPMSYKSTDTKWRIVDCSTNKGNAFGALVGHRQIGGMGQSVDGFDATIQSRQSMQTIKLSNNRTLIYGGRRSPYKPSPMWSTVEGESTGSDELLSVYRAATCQMGQAGLQFGGRGVDGVFLRTLIRIELESELSTVELRPRDELLPELASATIISVNNYVYIIGGLLESGAMSSQVFKIEVEGEHYRIESVSSLGFGIYGHQCVKRENELLLIGGVSTLACDDDYIVRFDLATSEVKVDGVDVDNSLMLMHGHYATGDNDRVQIIGGGNNCFSFGTYLNRSSVVLEKY